MFLWSFILLFLSCLNFPTLDFTIPKTKRREFENVFLKVLYIHIFCTFWLTAYFVNKMEFVELMLLKNTSIRIRTTNTYPPFRILWLYLYKPKTTQNCQFYDTNKIVVYISLEFRYNTYGWPIKSSIVQTDKKKENFSSFYYTFFQYILILPKSLYQKHV